jgi:hypothetical protein
MKLEDVIQKGTLSARPDAVTPGALYFSTDNGKVYRSFGGAWDDVTPAGGAVTSLTTVGSSGPATLTDGVLNIPQYSGGGGSGSSGAFAGPNATWQFDDFLSDNLGSALGFTLNGGGGGIFYQNACPDGGNRPGNWDLQASSGNWAYTVLSPFNGAKAAVLSSAVAAAIIASCFSSAGGQTRFGWFNNTGTPAPGDCVYFCHDTVANGNGNWWAYCVVGGTVTKTDTGIAAGAWDTLEIDVAGTAATFKINNASVATGTISAGVIMTPGFMSWGTNSVQADLWFDWFAIQMNYAR